MTSRLSGLSVESVGVETNSIQTESMAQFKIIRTSQPPSSKVSTSLQILAW